MYYAKWKGDDDYFIGMNHQCSWGPLNQAVGFNSKAEIERLFREYDANHWLPKIEVIFLHPLNVEQRLLGNC